jgi:hypothetical protein
MFSASSNKGFQITFANGNTVSVQWGPHNYCNPTHELGREAEHDAPQQQAQWGSTTAEVAAWNSDGQWHNCGGDQVKGWLSPAEVVEFINFVATSELDTSDPFDFGYGAEEEEEEDCASA